MNVRINFEVTTTVRWNALEKSIIGLMYDEETYPSETEYSKQDLVTLNGDIARAMNPDNDEIKMPERFLTPDHTGDIPAEKLFDNTETLISNMERAENRCDEFTYDPSASL